MPASELFFAIRQTAEKARLQAVAVAIQDLETGWAFAHDEQRWFHAASTFKVGILLSLLKATADGRMRMDDQLHVRNRFHSIIRDAPPFRVHSTRDGDPMVYGHIGRSLSLGALAHAMITRSSNLATNLLMDYLTIRTVRETMQQAKVTELNILRGVEDLAAHEQGIDNEATAMGLLQLMRHFTEQSDFLPAPQREEGVRILLQQEFNRMIPAKLPSGTKVAHKTGEISTHSHDVGVVFPKGRKPYILTVLTQSQPDDAGRSSAVAEIAAAAHAAVLKAKPLSEPALPA